jgi:hypothetical protein
MSARPRKPPTQDPIEDGPTTIYDSSEDHRPPGSKPAGNSARTVLDKPPPAKTIVDPPKRTAGPTLVDKPKKANKPPTPAPGLPLAAGSAPPELPKAPVVPRNPTGPIQAVSMKTPGAHRPEPVANPPTPILPRPKLRAASEVAPVKQQNLGHMAKPYDPVEARKRRMREYVIWGCIAVILASAIALVVWFVAR